MPNEHDSTMTKADRANLERLARKRAKVAESMIGERIKVLRAEVEDHLSAKHTIDDELWTDVAREAQAAIARADAHIAAVCARLGISEDLRPSIELSWRARGENALASRRVELRRLAYARIDAAAESAKVVIRANLLDVETELIRGGLESAEAMRFVETMPTVEQLMPVVDVVAIGPGPSVQKIEEDGIRHGGYGGWKPPTHAGGELLTPSSASTREARRQAAVAALAANRDASNREIARAAGVDHKTVGKLRGELAGTSPPTGGADANGNAEGHR